MSDIIETKKMLQNPEVINNDIKEIIGLVTDSIKNKYIKRINNAIVSQNRELEKNPPKEIVLLKAMKEFFPSNRHKEIDNTINVYMQAYSMKRMREKLAPEGTIFSMSAKSNNPSYGANGAYRKPNDIKTDCSIHSDGIYDIDEECIIKKGKMNMSNVLLAMAMLKR